MQEGEYSDTADQSSFKKVFQVDYIADGGEEKSTRVMAMDDKEAGRMLAQQKGVKSVVKAELVREGAKEGVEEAGEEVAYYAWVKEEDRGSTSDRSYTGTQEDLVDVLSQYPEAEEQFNAQGWAAFETEQGVQAIAKDQKSVLAAKKAAVRLWIRQEADLGGLDDDEYESVDDKHARRTAESLLGLSQPPEDNTDVINVGDTIQIVKRRNFEMVVEEATVRQLDEKKGIEITGNTIPGRQMWYGPDHYMAIKL